MLHIIRFVLCIILSIVYFFLGFLGLILGILPTKYFIGEERKSDTFFEDLWNWK